VNSAQNKKQLGIKKKLLYKIQISYSNVLRQALSFISENSLCDKAMRSQEGSSFLNRGMWSPKSREMTIMAILSDMPKLKKIDKLNPSLQRKDYSLRS